MRYAQITPFEVCNGKGAGVSLFVQGCRFHCKGCFNQKAWDFNGGKEWNEEIKNKFFELIERPYIKRVSILGGEPLEKESVEAVYDLIIEIRKRFPNKDIWLYTGYKYEDIIEPKNCKLNEVYLLRATIVKMCDVLVDGRYVDELRDVTLKFAGSKNQRLIDVRKTLKNSQVILYE